MTIVPAGTIADAASLLRARAFDAVVADPLDDEVLGILSIVRAEEESVPIVLFMEPGHERVVIDAVNSGLDRYVEKSGTPADRFDALERPIEHLVRRDLDSASLHRQNEFQEFHSRTAMDFIRMGDEEDIYRYIAKEVYSLVRAPYIGILLFDPAASAFTMRHIAPAEPAARVVREELGYEIVGLSFQLDAESVPQLGTALGCDRLVEVANSFYYGCGKALPEEACDRSQERLDVGKMYSMGFNCREGLYGMLTIGVRRGEELGDLGLIEAFVRHASVALLRQHVRARLRESEARYRAVVESQQELICRFAPDGTHRFSNEAYCRFFGLEADAVIGHRFVPGIPEEERISLRDYFVTFSPDRPDRTSECPVRCPDGSTRWLQWHDRAFFDRDGILVEFQSVGRDVTERKEAEEALAVLTVELERRVDERRAELQAANENLEARSIELGAANHDLEAFSHQVSHDLRAPLRAIDGYLGILMARFGPEFAPDAIAYIGRAREGVHRADRFLEGLLSLTRLSRQPLRSETVDTEELVRAVLAETVPEQDGRRLELTVGPLPTCRADPEMLRHVYQNLLSNAVKFTRDRDPARITVRAEERDGEIVYQVRDNGVGFPPGDAARLFDDFTRFHSAREFEGSGIGLALVRRIVERHGGRCWAESETGGGATFSFTLEA